MTFLKHLKEFVKTMKLLANNLMLHYNDDPIMAMTRDRMMLICREQPQLLIDVVGKWLYENKDQIYSMDEDYFVNMSVTFTNADFNHIFNRLVELTKKLDAKEKKPYYKLVQKLLDEYVAYKISVLQS